MLVRRPRAWNKAMLKLTLLCGTGSRATIWPSQNLFGLLTCPLRMAAVDIERNAQSSPGACPRERHGGNSLRYASAMRYGTCFLSEPSTCVASMGQAYGAKNIHEAT